MADFTLRIYQRRRPHDTAGPLSQLIRLDADDLDTAKAEAGPYLDRLNWETHFAGLMDERKFLKFWSDRHA